MTVIVSDEAWKDLERVGGAIAEHDLRQATILIDDLLRACATLEEMPFRYALVERRKNRGLRRRPHGNYLIFYVVENGAVQIVRILHGAMDYEPILFPTD